MSRDKSKDPKKTAAMAEEILLSGDLTLQTAGAVKELFARAVAGGGDTTFRFADVGDVDLSFIQILCAAQTTAQSKGNQLHFEGDWPESLARLLEDSGLNTQVRCSPDGDVKCPWINHTTDEQL